MHKPQLRPMVLAAVVALALGLAIVFTAPAAPRVAAQPAGAAITISPDSGPPGTAVTATGTGWNAYRGWIVTVAWFSGHRFPDGSIRYGAIDLSCKVRVGSDGRFTVVFQIPWDPDLLIPNPPEHRLAPGGFYIQFTINERVATNCQPSGGSIDTRQGKQFQVTTSAPSTGPSQPSPPAPQPQPSASQLPTPTNLRATPLPNLRIHLDWDYNGPEQDVLFFIAEGPDGARELAFVADGIPAVNRSYMVTTVLHEPLVPGHHCFRMSAYPRQTGAYISSGWSNIVCTDLSETAAPRVPTPSTTVTVTDFWATDAAGTRKSTFIRGSVEELHYTAVVLSTGSSPVTAHVELTLTLPVDDLSCLICTGYTVTPVSGDQSIAPGESTERYGTDWWSNQKAIPSDAPTGEYTATYSITYNGITSRRTTTFTIAASSPSPTPSPAADCQANDAVGLWNLEQIRAREAWALFPSCRPPAVTVAVIDTGIDRSQSDLRVRIRSVTDYVDATAETKDNDGHGTAVAAIIAAEANNAIGVAGVAPTSRLDIYKTWTNSQHRCALTDFICFLAAHSEALTLAESLREARSTAQAICEASRGGASVINVSIGYPDLVLFPTKGAFEEAIKCAAATDTVVVVATPYTVYSDRVYPASFAASYDNVIAVSASDDLGEVAALGGSPYTMAAPWVTVAAPGGSNDSALLPVTSLAAGRTPESACVLGEPVCAGVVGTSFAAPHVTGVVALMRAANPDLTPAQIKDILRRHATPWSDTVLGQQYGAGIVNAEAAVKAVMELRNPADSASGSPERTTVVRRDAELPDFILNIAMGPDDVLYVTGEHQVWKLQRDGAAVRLAGTEEPGWVDGAATSARLGDTRGIAVGPDGSVYLSEYQGFAGSDFFVLIRKISPDGRVQTVAGGRRETGARGRGEPVDGPGESARLVDAGDLLVDHDGTVYFTDGTRLRKISPNGVVSTIVDATPADSPYGSLSGLAMDFDGSILTTRDARSEVIRISPSGGITTVADGLSRGPYGGMIALDRNGLYVVTLRPGTIQRVERSGRVTTLTDGPSGLDIGCVRGIAVDGRGAIYVASIGYDGISQRGGIWEIRPGRNAWQERPQMPQSWHECRG